MEAEEAVVGVTGQGLHLLIVATHPAPHVSVEVATHHQDAVTIHPVVTTVTAHHAGRRTLLTNEHPVTSLVVATHPHAVAVEGLPPLWMMGTDAHILMNPICQRGVLRTTFLLHRMLTAVVAEVRSQQWTIWAQLGVVACHQGEEGEEEAHLGIIVAEAVTETMIITIVVVVSNCFANPSSDFVLLDSVHPTVLVSHHLETSTEAVDARKTGNCKKGNKRLDSACRKLT